ncbi:intraflagellar transport protein IFT88 [Angomonas deanei]|nr:intraflagellar transport protein IFT88 [Angomonas deanei]|eukprot:EPY42100.1 intraflagellar transport protein IFT88 [Angomonas deanei]
MDVISWLGAYFVKNEVYDKAIQFFERASQIQPQEVRWPLMIASCHRRRGDVVQAKRLYEQVHRKNPDNVECIKYLVQLCKDSGLVEEANEWFKEMKKAERKQLNEGGSGEDEEKEATAEAEGESTAGRRRGGTGLTSDMTAGFSDDDVDKKLRKKKDSDSDEDLDIPGLE